MANNHPTDVKEIWKLVPSFPDYEASNLGRLRRRVHKSNIPAGYILKPQKVRSGYMTCRLYNPIRPGKSFDIKVHTAIAEAFLGPRPKGCVLNHKNGIKIDNRPDNLEYVTQSENQRHAYILGLQKGMKGKTNPSVKLTEEDVQNIRTMLAQGISQRAIAMRYGITQTTVSRIKLSKSWKHI